MAFDMFELKQIKFSTTITTTTTNLKFFSPGNKIRICIFQFLGKSLIITPKQKLSIETTSVKQQQKQQQKSLNLINTKSSSITTKNDIKSQIINGKFFKGKIITTTSISPKNIDSSSSSTVASSISSDFSSPIKINVSEVQ
ncbi:hypothetical protein DERP_014770 [Dermatophagoides pteronyssinus]|uniref:Uncharacterized protein n=1 Tax=Dermatophagoides pteronyssinus TaxID=6956 RepID=A0ABQ8JCT7_DERPT|nr:hypothetical protein DERP_014770 [Dermatophagoides pteronyssinus]